MNNRFVAHCESSPRKTSIASTSSLASAFSPAANTPNCLSADSMILVTFMDYPYAYQIFNPTTSPAPIAVVSLSAAFAVIAKLIPSEQYSPIKSKSKSYLTFDGNASVAIGVSVPTVGVVALL